MNEHKKPLRSSRIGHVCPQCVDKDLVALYICFCAYIQGVGRRYANLVCKKADIDMNKRAGELTDEEVRVLVYSS